jgi:hypothetical protein
VTICYDSSYPPARIKGRLLVGKEVAMAMRDQERREAVELLDGMKWLLDSVGKDVCRWAVEMKLDPKVSLLEATRVYVRWLQRRSQVVDNMMHDGSKVLDEMIDRNQEEQS